MLNKITTVNRLITYTSQKKTRKAIVKNRKFEDLKVCGGVEKSQVEQSRMLTCFSN